MDTQKRTEWIEQYLQNELNEEELSQFKLKMQTDANFQREVNVQQAILVGLHKKGQSATRQKIKDIQERINLPWPAESKPQDKPEADSIKIEFPKPTKVRLFPYYAVAATITLLLIASLVGYYFYTGSPTTPTIVGNNSNEIGSKAPKVAMIPFKQSRGSRELGFGGADKKDTTIAILLYPDEKNIKLYQFDDTLRLYGPFSPTQLSLQLDLKTGKYTLRENTVLYPLLRYQPRKPLNKESFDE